MLPVFFIVLVGALTATSVAVRASFNDVVLSSAEGEAAASLDRYSRNLQRLNRAGGLPGDLSALLDDGESEPHPWVRYAVSRDIVGSTWRFDRAMIWVATPGANEEPVDLLSASSNACGSNDFDEAGSYCPPPEVQFYRLETIDRSAEQISGARLSLIRTMRKMLSGYYETGSFPNQRADGGGVTPSESVPMAQMVGFAGNALNCSGIFLLGGVPYDCSDLFTPPFGNPTLYYYISPSEAGFLTETDLLRPDGTTVVVGTEGAG